MLYNRFLEIRFPDSGVIIGGRHEFDGYSIRYPVYSNVSVNHTSGSSPNDATVTVFNLSNHAQETLMVEGNKIEIEAGYWPQGGYRETSLIFSGQIRKALTNRSGTTDTATVITCGDGDDGYAHSRARAIVEEPTPGSIFDQLMVAFEAQGLQRGEVRLPDVAAEARPRTIDRSARRELTDLAYQYDLQWSIQDGYVNVWPRDEARLDTGYVLGPETGIIGNPQFTDKGVTLKTMMLGHLRPGDTFLLENRATTFGPRSPRQCKIKTVNFSGGLDSNQFGASVESTYMSDGKVERHREQLYGGVT